MLQIEATVSILRSTFVLDSIRCFLVESLRCIICSLRMVSLSMMVICEDLVGWIMHKPDTYFRSDL